MSSELRWMRTHILDSIPRYDFILKRERRIHFIRGVRSDGYLCQAQIFNDVWECPAESLRARLDCFLDETIPDSICKIPVDLFKGNPEWKEEPNVQ